MNEPASALAGAVTGIASGTDDGLQLLTRGRLPAGGGGVSGDGVILRLGDGLLVGLGVGLALGTVASDTPEADGIGVSTELPERSVAQPAATNKTAMPDAATTALCR